ncbi:MAG: hypothetical protein LBJ12_09875 [Oscillospiraceae bacterium]|jgi:hypothetical protein|nr:hypothetical protein [Oscillospiraceae bacterium]
MKFMRRFMSLILVIGALATAAGVFTVPVSAATAYPNIAVSKKLTIGTNIAYMVHGTCKTNYLSRIVAARERIMYPPGLSNPIILWRTETYADSKMDFYQVSETAGNWYGSTTRFRRVAPGSATSSFSAISLAQADTYDWIYGEIKLNHPKMQTYSAAKQELVIVHEMLHVYGCKDLTGGNSIMLPIAIHTGTVTQVTKDANDVLVEKY